MTLERRETIMRTVVVCATAAVWIADQLTKESASVPARRPAARRKW